MQAVRVKAQSQLVVPEEIQEACGIVPGDELLFVQTGPGAFQCSVVSSRQSLMELVDRYSSAGAAPDLAKLRSEMAAELAREYVQPGDAE